MAQVPPGSYEETSKDIKFVGEPGKTDCILKAKCRKVDGSWVESELKYDIANLDGKLSWHPK